MSESPISSKPPYGLIPIDARKRADQVRDSLIALIRSGELKDGEKLPTEQQLAAMFGVGRSSIREAVQSLIGLGIIEMRPGRGAYVSRMSLNDLVRMVDGAVRLEYGAALHVHEVRAMIEITSARLAAARRTDADLITMRETIERYRVHHAPTDSEVLITADLDFHRSVVEATHNEMMVQLLGSISGLLREHRRQYVTPTAQGIHDVVVEQHEGIYEAIVSGDPRLAAAKMQEHMRNIWSQIEELAIHEGDASIGEESYLPMYED